MIQAYENNIHKITIIVIIRYTTKKIDIDGIQLICISVNQPDIMNIQHFRHSVKLVQNALLFGILWHYHLQLPFTMIKVVE